MILVLSSTWVFTNKLDYQMINSNFNSHSETKTLALYHSYAKLGR